MKKKNEEGAAINPEVSKEFKNLPLNYRQDETMALPVGARLTPRPPAPMGMENFNGIKPALNAFFAHLGVIFMSYETVNDKDFREKVVLPTVFSCSNCGQFKSASICVADKPGNAVIFGNQRCIDQFRPKIQPWEKGGDPFEVLVKKIRSVDLR
ncbi:MAG: hypothetical protein C0392_01040 [Syntrophus sp. (in: bacteria)]|nr:hypothetical protein [Syntrophus sp. (in: bacteria)]